MDTDYNDGLVERIKEAFADVYTSEFLISLVHEHPSFLHPRVAERLKKKFEKDDKIPYDKNCDLLDYIKRFDNWFDYVMKILEDVEKRQTHIADRIKKIKAEWDEEYKKKPSQSEQSKKNSEQSKKKSEQSKKKSEQSKKKSEQSKKNSEQSKKKPDAPIKNNRKRKSKEELNLDSSPVTDTKKFKKDSSKTNETNDSLQECQCGCCNLRSPKDFCCVQIVNSIIEKYPKEKKKTCLTKWKVIGKCVVNRSFLENKNKENKWINRTPQSNKQFYLVACKVFTRLVYGKLGKGEWRDIPSCLKNEIGKYFPCKKYRNKRKSF